MTQTISPPSYPESADSPTPADPSSVLVAENGAHGRAESTDSNETDLPEQGEAAENGQPSESGERPPSGRRRRRRGGGGMRERREANEQMDNSSQGENGGVPMAAQ